MRTIIEIIAASIFCGFLDLVFVKTGLIYPLMKIAGYFFFASVIWFILYFVIWEGFLEEIITSIKKHNDNEK